jgi:hypothetical protein
MWLEAKTFAPPPPVGAGNSVRSRCAGVLAGSSGAPLVSTGCFRLPPRPTPRRPRRTAPRVHRLPPDYAEPGFRHLQVTSRPPRLLAGALGTHPRALGLRPRGPTLRAPALPMLVAVDSAVPPSVRPRPQSLEPFGLAISAHLPRELVNLPLGDALMSAESQPAVANAILAKAIKQ